MKNSTFLTLMTVFASVVAIMMTLFMDDKTAALIMALVAFHASMTANICSAIEEKAR
jgi:hypothetical protein